MAVSIPAGNELSRRACMNIESQTGMGQIKGAGRIVANRYDGRGKKMK